MMSSASRFLFPALILGLVALAAFGIRQVIVGSGDAQAPPLEPQSFEAPPPPLPETREERRRVLDLWSEGVRDMIQQFVDSGADPCSLPPLEFHVEPFAPYEDLPALVNDTELIVLGRPVGHSVQPPQPATDAGQILVTLAVDEVLAGADPGATITVDLFDGVMINEDSPVRAVGGDVDGCAQGQLLLLLVPTSSPDVFRIRFQSWARIGGGEIEHAEVNHLFDRYTDGQSLVAAVHQVVAEQAGQDLLKGVLACEATRTSVIVCPGEAINPYQALRLDLAPQASIAGTELSAGPELSAVLAALNVTVTMEPFGPLPDDLIRLTVTLARPIDSSANVFSYSPGQGIVRMGGFSGQFPAPPAFQEAMAQFLPP